MTGQYGHVLLANGADGYARAAFGRYVLPLAAPPVQDLVELDDEYDEQGPSPDLDQRVSAAARALLS